jgi:hypothetical protein
VSEFDPLSLPPGPPPPMAVVPVPFQSNYAPTSGYAGRPGLVTTIGVFCIIVAGISLIFGGFLGLINFNIASSTRTKAVRAGVPVVAPPPPKAAIAELIPDGGMHADDRRLVVDAVAGVHPLTEAEMNQLDELLAVDGQKLFPSDVSTPLTTKGVQSEISSSRPLGQDSTQGEMFFIGDGRIEVSDERAAFMPNDGSDSVVVTAPTFPPLTNAAPPPGFTDDQIRSILRAITQSSGQHLSPTQSKSLIELLRRPGQQFVVPRTDGSDAANEVEKATVNQDGSLEIVTTAGSNTTTLDVAPNGTISNTITLPTIPPINFNPRIDHTAAMWTGSLTFVNLLLAVYLLVVGIFIFRQSFKAWWMAWIFIVLKLPVTLGCGFAAIAMWNSLIASATGTPQSLTQALEIYRAVFATPPFLGAIFPPILALLLIAPSVRKYYSSKITA